MSGDPGVKLPRPVFTPILWRIAFVVYVVGAVASAVIMLALAAAGFIEMGRGVIQQFSSATGHEQPNEGSPVGLVLKGLELIFLAPMAYLTFLTLWRYVEGNRKGVVDSSLRRQVMEIKSLIVGLIIAVVATDLLGDVLSPIGAGYESAITGCLIIAVLGAYVIGLEKARD